MIYWRQGLEVWQYGKLIRWVLDIYSPLYWTEKVCNNWSKILVCMRRGLRGQHCTHRYIDRYIQPEVSRIASMGSLRLTTVSLVLTLTRFALVRTYVHTTYVHTCVATAPHYFSIHTRTYNIADIILTPDVEDLHTCSTPYSLLLLHQHQSHCC